MPDTITIPLTYAELSELYSAVKTNLEFGLIDNPERASVARGLVRDLYIAGQQLKG